jgi:hypothetical protein
VFHLVNFETGVVATEEPLVAGRLGDRPVLLLFAVAAFSGASKTRQLTYTFILGQGDASAK